MRSPNTINLKLCGNFLKQKGNFPVFKKVTISKINSSGVGSIPFRALLVVCLVIFSCNIGIGQDTTLFNVPKINTPVKLDGQVTEQAWENLEPLSLVMHWPTYGNPSTDTSEIRVGYDEEYLYLSCRCFADPENISAPTFKRDAWKLNMDQLGLVLDTYNDNENAVIFVVTPTGSRVDHAIKNDAQGSFPINTWNAFWAAETTINDKGWHAEMRIPFSSLRFQTKNGKAKMGLTTYRYNAHKGEQNIFPAIPTNWGFWSFVKPSQTQTSVFQDLKTDNPLYVTPYALGGIRQKPVLNSNETGYNNAPDLSGKMGLDVKIGLKDNLTLDLTVNTDFAQVEADARQVNLTRFSLFFPEQRQFFLERSAIFSFPFGKQDRLFHSRRIGLHNRQPVQILGGARLNGRLGDWDVGGLSMQTGRDRGLPSENFSVARFRRQVFNDRSYAGGIMTSRIDENGNYNLAYGVDGTINTFGNDYLLFNAAQTLDNSSPASPVDPSGSRVRMQWEKRKFQGFGYKLDYQYAGKQYNPGIGFQLRENYTKFGDQLFYGWMFDDSTPLTRFKAGLAGSYYLDNSTGELVTSEYGVSWSINTESKELFMGKIFSRTENIRESFKVLGSIPIPAAKYKFYRGMVEYRTPRREMLRTILKLEGGGYFDGRSITASINPEWDPSRYFKFGGYFEYSRIAIPARDQSMNTYLARLRAELSLNTKISMSTYGQYIHAPEQLGIINFRLRYNPRDGNDFYLVFNERLNLNRNGEVLEPPLSKSRQILLKYNHTFRF